MPSFLKLAIDKLAVEFDSLDLSFHSSHGLREGDVTSYFPGSADEDVMVCVFKGKEICEPFHRQDFFFINYAYHDNYDALSARYDNQITIRENECYIGQPYSGYALRGHSDTDIVIIGILIRKEAFFREYLQVLSADSSLFHFFLEPQTHRFSDEFIHLSFEKGHPVRTLLELMVIEYANRAEDTQAILKSMLFALLMHLSRRHRAQQPQVGTLTLTEQMVAYITDHMDTITLKALAKHFSYHPAYISALLPRETGKTFKEILLEQRMERAVILLRNTTLSIEEISAMIGYSDHSNFYKAFREYYQTTPRDFINHSSWHTAVF